MSAAATTPNAAFVTASAQEPPPPVSKERGPWNWPKSRTEKSVPPQAAPKQRPRSPNYVGRAGPSARGDSKQEPYITSTLTRARSPNRVFRSDAKHQDESPSSSAGVMNTLNNYVSNNIGAALEAFKHVYERSGLGRKAKQEEPQDQHPVLVPNISDASRSPCPPPPEKSLKLSAGGDSKLEEQADAS